MIVDFLKELLELHPELADDYNSPQYKMSLKIIDKMMELSFDSKQMASYLGLGYDDYVRMESGDTSIGIYRYEQVLEKIKVV